MLAGLTVALSGCGALFDIPALPAGDAATREEAGTGSGDGSSPHDSGVSHDGRVSDAHVSHEAAASCNATTCPNGCCKGGTSGTCELLAGQSPGACGTGGSACAACDSTQVCVLGQCTCNASSCPAGCCNGSTCVPYMAQSSEMCGTAGASCAACASASDSCAMGLCGCGGAACDGCCNSSNVCVPYASESNASCGQNGAGCQPCNTTGSPPQQCTGGAAVPASADGTCCGATEICDNGIDDNCDGKVDCEDPECTSGTGQPAGAWACATLPSGTVNGVQWYIAAFDQTSNSLSCPDNYSGGRNSYYSNVGFSMYSCSCSCSNTKPAYCTGDWSYVGYGSSVGGCPSPTYNTNFVAFDTSANATQSCSNFTESWPDNDYFIGKAVTASPQPGTCSGTSSPKSSPPPTYDTGEACALPAAGAGCSGSQACVPVNSNAANFQICAVATGKVLCPDGLMQYLINDAPPSESHTCTGCSCTSDTSTVTCDVTAMSVAPTDCATAYPGGYCAPGSGAGTTFAFAANTCTPSKSYGGNELSRCISVTASGTTSCSPSGSAPSANGSVSPVGAQYTVCCP